MPARLICISPTTPRVHRRVHPLLSTWLRAPGFKSQQVLPRPPLLHATMQLVYSKGRKRSAARGEPVSNLCIGPMAPLALCAARALPNWRLREDTHYPPLTPHPAVECTCDRPLSWPNQPTREKLAARHSQATVQPRPPPCARRRAPPAHLEGRILRAHERLFGLFDFDITCRAPAQIACTVEPHESAI